MNYIKEIGNSKKYGLITNSLVAQDKKMKNRH